MGPSEQLGFIVLASIVYRDNLKTCVIYPEGSNDCLNT